jgi:hypothetical protein
MKTHRSLRLLAAGLFTLAAVSTVSAQLPNLRTFDFNVPLKPLPPIKKYLGRVEPDFSPAARASRPTLVVLIHGGTSNPASAPSAFEPNRPTHRPGMIGYSRFYWDFPFVSALLNVPSSGQLRTMGGVTLNAASWKNEAIGNIGPNDFENQFAFAADPAASRGNFRGVATCLVKYNGSIGLGQMARQATAQLMMLREKFEAYSGREPYFVLAGHSKGGLVIRYLLSIPEGSVAGANFTAEERTFLNELRNDTRFAMTISSPHTGSPLADHGDELRRNLISTQQTVNAAWNVLRTAASVIRINLPVAAPINLTLAADMISSNDGDLGHLTSEFWQRHNTNELHPSKMRRQDGSMVPVYLYGGRRPSHLTDGLALFPTAPTRLSTVAAQSQMMVSRLAGTEDQKISASSAIALSGLDWALHNISRDNWGRIRNAGTGKPLDLTRRSFYTPLLNRMSAPGAQMLLPPVEGVPTYYMINQQDRETDNDGMVGIDSALGVGLMGGIGVIEFNQSRGFPIPSSLMEPFDHTQNIAPAGQPFRAGPFYRRYSGNWNFQSHFTQIKRPELGVQLRSLVNTAGPLTSTGALSEWPTR